MTKELYAESDIEALARNCAVKYLNAGNYHMVEDAIQEFRIGAWGATQKTKCNRGYQYQRGVGSMLDFIRKQILHDRREIATDLDSNKIPSPAVA